MVANGGGAAKRYAVKGSDTTMITKAAVFTRTKKLKSLHHHYISCCIILVL